MIAMSSGQSRLTSCFVRRSRRAVPVNSVNLIPSKGREELRAAEHPLELLLLIGVRKRLDACVGAVARDLLDAKMRLGGARDLWQVRDRQHLGPLGDPTEGLRDSVGGSAPNTGVDLV